MDRHHDVKKISSDKKIDPCYRKIMSKRASFYIAFQGEDSFSITVDEINFMDKACA